MDLDDAYANGPYIPHADTYPPKWAKEASAFRTALGKRAALDVVYGDGPRQTLDLFHPEGAAAGTVVFIHGGYWRAFDKSTWSHFAGGALARGWRVAMPSYDLCPQVRIGDITHQIQKAVTKVALECDGPLRITGHSAGGHLTARMVAPGMLAADIAARVHKIVPISPLSDLEPLMKTSMNADFKLTRESAKAESPIHQPQPGMPVTVLVGAQERPAFISQAKDLGQAWSADVVTEDNKHHFDVIDGLCDPDSALTNAVLGS